MVLREHVHLQRRAGGEHAAQRPQLDAEQPAAHDRGAARRHRALRAVDDFDLERQPPVVRDTLRRERDRHAAVDVRARFAGLEQAAVAALAALGTVVAVLAHFRLGVAQPRLEQRPAHLRAHDGRAEEVVRRDPEAHFVTVHVHGAIGRDLHFVLGLAVVLHRDRRRAVRPARAGGQRPVAECDVRGQLHLAVGRAARREARGADVQRRAVGSGELQRHVRGRGHVPALAGGGARVELPEERLSRAIDRALGEQEQLVAALLCFARQRRLDDRDAVLLAHRHEAEPRAFASRRDRREAVGVRRHAARARRGEHRGPLAPSARGVLSLRRADGVHRDVAERHARLERARPHDRAIRRALHDEAEVAHEEQRAPRERARAALQHVHARGQFGGQRHLGFAPGLMLLVLAPLIYWQII